MRNLKEAGSGTKNRYLISEGRVKFSDHGDIIATGDETLEQFCDLMNGILSDPFVRELVTKRLEFLN